MDSSAKRLGAMKTSCVMVTGANGFVGQVLCAEAIRRNLRIRGAMRSAGELPAGAEPVIVGAIDGATDWTDALRGVDAVIHLAARVHVMKEPAADPLAEFLRINLHGTANIARQAVRAGVRRFVYVSSIKVNGEQTTGTQSFTESDRPDPQDAYAVSKWQAEQALQHIAQETGLEVVIVRPPLVYGPGVKGNFIKLLAAIDRGVPLPLAGAHNIRSLVYAGNLADALIACASHPDAVGQTYLVTDSNGVSMAALVEKIAHALGRHSRSFYFPPSLLRATAVLFGRAEQVDRLFGSLRASDEKIRSELSWLPPYTLEQGLRETADWFRGEHSTG